MADIRLLAATALLFAASVGYGHVARLLWRLDAPARFQATKSAFAVWWAALAASTLVMAAQNALALAGVVDLPLHLTLSQIFLLFHALALAGLLAYLLLLMERRRVWPAVAALYLATFAAFTWLLFALDPVAVTAGPVSAGYQVERSAAVGVLDWVGVALFVPHIAAAGAYATLYRRVDDATQRYRIALVSTSIVVWALAQVGLSVGFSRGAADLELLMHLIAVVAPAGTYLAYAPPAALRHRFGLRAMA